MVEEREGENKKRGRVGLNLIQGRGRSSTNSARKKEGEIRKGWRPRGIQFQSLLQAKNALSIIIKKGGSQKRGEEGRLRSDGKRRKQNLKNED